MIVRLQAHGDVLVVDPHVLVRVEARLAVAGGRDVCAGRVLGEHTRQVDDARELVRVGRARRGRGDADAVRRAGAFVAARERDEVVRERRADRELGDEGALAVVVARVLLDDDVPVARAPGRDPLEAVDVLERDLARADGLVRVVVLRRVAAVRVLALAVELDARRDVDLALDVDVVGRDLGREARRARDRVEERGHARVVDDAEVAGRRRLDVAEAAVRVGRVVLRLLARHLAAARVPERVAVRGEVLEGPRAVLLELLDRAVPHPVDGREVARDRVAARARRDFRPVIAEEPARRRRDVGREAVELAVRKAVAREVARRVRRAVGRAALEADVDARRDDVLGIHVRVAVGGGARLDVGRVGAVDPEVAVVARGREAHVVGVAAVDLDDLLEAAEREDANRIRRLGREVDRVRGDARVVGAVDKVSPLLVGEEERVDEANARAPLLRLLEVRRAERLHEPVDALARRRVGHDVLPERAARGVRVREVRAGAARRDRGVGVARGHLVAEEVVRLLDELARALDHRFGRARAAHEVDHEVAVVVDVVHVRAREGRARRGHRERVRLPVHRAVALRLEDDADRRGVEQVRAHAVGHAGEHVARRRVVLANCADRLRVVG